MRYSQPRVSSCHIRFVYAVHTQFVVIHFNIVRKAKLIFLHSEAINYPWLVLNKIEWVQSAKRMEFFYSHHDIVKLSEHHAHIHCNIHSSGQLCISHILTIIRLWKKNLIQCMVFRFCPKLCADFTEYKVVHSFLFLFTPTNGFGFLLIQIICPLWCGDSQYQTTTSPERSNWKDTRAHTHTFTLITNAHSLKRFNVEKRF